MKTLIQDSSLILRKYEVGNNLDEAQESRNKLKVLQIVTQVEGCNPKCPLVSRFVGFLWIYCYSDPEVVIEGPLPASDDHAQILVIRNYSPWAIYRKMLALVFYVVPIKWRVVKFLWHPLIVTRFSQDLYQSYNCQQVARSRN